MHVRKAIAFLLMSSLLALGVVPAAVADSYTWRDPGGRGPLAISGVKVRHWPDSEAPRLTITFNQPLKASRMGPKDFIVLDYEGNGKRPSDGWIYVVSRRGRLFSFEYNPTTGETYGSIGFHRPTPRSLDLVPWNYNVGGYAVSAVSYSENAAAGCAGGCWDFAPDRGYLVHDWTAPEFQRFEAPSPIDQFWHEPTIPVTWRATDMGLSGLARTSVVWREPEEAKWRRLVTRTGGGRHEERVKAIQGAHMLIQGEAEDGAGNIATSYPTLLRVPWDDANESGPGMFTGAWARQEDPDASRESFNLGTGPATLTFADTGSVYCVVVRSLDLEPARARLQVDGGSAQDVMHDAGDPGGRFPVCVGTEEPGEHTATFVVLAGRLGVDGYWAGGDGTGATRAAATPTGAGIGHMVRARPSRQSLARAASLR